MYAAKGAKLIVKILSCGDILCAIAQTRKHFAMAFYYKVYLFILIVCYFVKNCNECSIVKSLYKYKYVINMSIY